MARSTAQVFEDHKNAILTGDFPKLIDDYADDAMLLTTDRTFVGQEAIRGFTQNLFAARPNVQVHLGKQIVEDDMLLLEWPAESDVATFEPGVDTSTIRDDGIQRQTMWFVITPRED